MDIDLSFIRKYVERNPYTGSPVVDLDGIAGDIELRRLLWHVWQDGWEAGLDDGISDCTVEQGHSNPYSG